jgi:ubiquinone/menaquinone biosynthesis C-methylase UbiE
VEEFWARVIKPSGQLGLNYWEYFAERLAQLANIANSSTVLDLGTCDGNVLIKAMKKMSPQGYGIGADIYYGGFKDGVAEAMRQGLEESIAFVQTDANALGFLSETFHTVLANFVGWDDCFDFERMEFIGPDKMTSEIMRVLRPGGQVGIGSWVEQSDIDWIVGAFKKYLPACEKDIIGYGKENPQGFKVILQSGGFENIQVYEETTNFVSPDAETWWRQMKQATNKFFRQISDPSVLESLKEQVFVDLQEFQYPEGIRFKKTVFFAFGTKPSTTTRLWGARHSERSAA